MAFPEPPSESHPLVRLFVVFGLLALAVLVYFALPRRSDGEGGRPGLPAFLLPAPTDTPPVTPTPLPTPTASPAPTAITPTSLPTPEPDAGPVTPVQARITGNVWCRSGPAVYYEAKAGFQPGVTTRVLGQYEGPEGNYWWVETDQGTRCWLPKRYAVLEVPEAGDRLPTVTPPPPPPVAFVVGVERVSVCDGRRGLTFWIRNAGTRLLQSVDIKVEGPNRSFLYALTVPRRNGFAWWLNCQAGGRLERLLPGETGFVTVDTGSHDLSGTPVTVLVKACTENNLQGLCLERRLLLPVP